MLALSAKRWQDCGKPGWWSVFGLVPVLGWLWLLVGNGLLPGQRQANRYGAGPQ